MFPLPITQNSLWSGGTGSATLFVDEVGVSRVQVEPSGATSWGYNHLARLKATYRPAQIAAIRMSA
jgi:hypothetical protein